MAILRASMGQPTHAPAQTSHDHGEHHHGAPPHVPPVHDEAPDSPMWLPLLGLSLLALFAVMGLWRAAQPDDVEAVEAAVEAPVEAPPAAAPAAAQ